MPVTLTPYALTDLATAKSHLGIKDTDTSQDDRVTKFINSATAWIERTTDRKLAKRTGLIQYMSGHRSNKLLLHEWPVKTVQHLWDDPDHKYQSDTELKQNGSPGVTDPDFDIDDFQTGIVKYTGTFSMGYRNIKCIYDAGYDSTDPEDALCLSELEMACLWLVEWFYRFRERQDIGRTQKGKGDENMQIMQNMPPATLQIILNYKRTEFPASDGPAFNS